MRKAANWLLAAVVGGGIGLATAQSVWAQRDTSSRERTTRTEPQRVPDLPAGIQMKDLNELHDIRGELGNITNKAVEKNNFGSFVGELTKQDRQRMSDYKDQDFKVLDGVIAQFQNDWKAKYGHDFNIKDQDRVYGDDFTIVQGVVTDPALAVNSFPVAPTMAAARNGRNEEGAQVAGSKEQRTEAADEAKLEKGREVAVAEIPGDHGEPQITASFIHEKPDHWRFDIPNNLSSHQIHMQLQNHLTWLDQHKAQWPDDENAAYRDVTRHVVAALYNVDMPQSGERGHPERNNR